MSVVAWDGRTLATDRQATNAGMIREAAKSRELAPGHVIAWTGEQMQGLVLAQWYTGGAVVSLWPAFQRTERWTRLVVASEGRLFEYEQEPYLEEIVEPFFAFGAGRDFAMGALAAGASARQAVEIACRWSDSCGLGIDVYPLTRR